MPLNTPFSDSAAPTRENVLADVKQIVSAFASLPPAEIKESHDLIADLEYDSLDVVETIMEVEEHFNISVPEDRAEQIHTVGDIADGVLRLLTR
jgi:acyl carrier protein